ncbi:transketolase [Buchnera aphidicola (Neophyllaphis varicolor)]|uniref:transketolase n=1 Tax=Buchnera aphidicola TaxID=9 RepID=UPI0031B82D58
MTSRKELANAIRMLSINAVQKANSGHPGAPMGMADIAEVLWRSFIKHNPLNPLWDNRDRFILSNGHSSILLYSILHLTGYDVSIEDIKNFRQLNSKTPGHPEINCCPGVETTTGPLGQGLAMAVGMAIAEKILGSFFNRRNYHIIDHHTWVFVGDGCLMEGISHEVCSLAGTLGLGKLIVLYDNNGISIDGKVNKWFTDNTNHRFSSYNWHVLNNIDGHDSEKIYKAINIAKKVLDKPSIIIFNTTIGFGSPNKSGKSEVHGAPLGQKEVELTKKNLGWQYSPFKVPDHIYKKWNAHESGVRLESEWNKIFLLYQEKYPDLALEYKRRKLKQLPIVWNKKINDFILKLSKNPENIATRQASKNFLDCLGKILPELLGGSADLTPSNLTKWSGSKSISNNNFFGNYIHFGVREFGMTAIANGIYQYGGFIPYTATFLMFVEYARNAVRMSALMKVHQILVYTHDSIGLGEDGPTHQPIEQLSSLRLTPDLSVWRPCDQLETAIAWKYAIEHNKHPSALILSRQNLPQISRDINQINNISRGGYILRDCNRIPDLIFISTGSELHLTVLAFDSLVSEGYAIRVISMPSTDVFDIQDPSYREFVMPSIVKLRIVVEAGVSDFWYKYVGLDGKVIGINSFGESAPGDLLFNKFGFTLKNIIKQSKSMLEFSKNK